MWISPIACFVGSVLIGLSLEVAVGKPEVKNNAEQLPFGLASVLKDHNELKDQPALSANPETKTALTSRITKRSFSPWGGKRKRKFSPWGGKRSGDMDVDGKSEEFDDFFLGEAEKRPSFQPWGGKRTAFENDEEDREGTEKRVAYPWSSGWLPDARSLDVNRFQRGAEVYRRGFNPWGGKRAGFQLVREVAEIDGDHQSI